LSGISQSLALRWGALVLGSVVSMKLVVLVVLGIAVAVWLIRDICRNFEGDRE